MITVNSTLDTDERDSALTLREAILINNRTLSVASLTQAEQGQISGIPTANDTDTIAFNIPGSGVHTIAPANQLPDITDPVIIDGYTQPGAMPNTNAIDDPDPAKRGFNGTLLVELAGSGAIFGGLTIAVGHSTVRGLVIDNFAGNGINLEGSNNVVEGNFIGTDPTGQSGLGNIGSGIDVQGASNRIGGTNPASRNVISDNRYWGIGLYYYGGDPLTQDNVIEGNFLGTDKSGTRPLGNHQVGVFFYQVTGNTIGGTQPGARNIIADNGTPLGGYGINLTSGGSNIVQGNYIGTDVSGSHPLGNHGAGVFDNGDSNLVGGTTVAARNVISGNEYGVVLSSLANVEGNFIGTDASGTAPLGNSIDGIDASAAAINSRIGGTVSGAGNRIAFNGRNGVTIESNYFGDSVLSNSIYGNGGLGIDLGSDGVTSNDAGDADGGTNNLQNFPEFTSATLVGGTNLTVKYSVPSDPANSAYPLRVEFFKADGTGRQGQTFLGFDTYQVAEAQTTKAFSFTSAVTLGLGERIVATATDADGNTSEFSAAVFVNGPTCDTVVINTNDSGAGSLRDAINCANSTPGMDTIPFNIPGNGVHTITPASGLPAIIDPVIIDGYTQPGSAPNSNAIDDADPLKRGLNGTLLIQLSGPPGGTPGMTGLVINASGSTVRGLIVNNFAHNGITLNGDNNVIAGNYIGTDPTGLTAAGNARWGVLINAGAAGNRIGTDGDGQADTAERNLISASGFAGVGIIGAGADSNVVAGNLIGTNASGTTALGNVNRGIDVSTGAQQNRIGTNSDGVNDGAERNVLSGNSWDGVGIYGAGTTQNVVAGNYIGVDITGSNPMGNVLHGVSIFNGAAGNIIGGLLPASGNRIAFNQLNGVMVVNPATIQDAVVGNSIFSNMGLGIDLGNDGPTANDSGDIDTGGNNKQNYPEMTYATRSGGMLKVDYSVPSDPANSTFPFRVEFFLADAAGQEGQTYLGFDSFTPADFAAGKKTVTFTAAASLKVGDKIVATATDSQSGGGYANTSEFSPSVVIASPWFNPRNRLDVNDDTHVAANDVVAVVNYLNAFKGGAVPDNADNSQPFLDVNGDSNIAPNDALDVINAINAGQGGEGEAQLGAPRAWKGEVPAEPSLANDLLALLAADPAIQSSRRRR